jgi:hypothetical protein
MTEFIWGMVLGAGIVAALGVFCYVLFMLAWARNTWR